MMRQLEVENETFDCMVKDTNTVIYHSEKRNGYVEVEFTGLVYRPMYEGRGRDLRDMEECLESQRPNNTNSRDEVQSKKYFPEV